MRRIGNGARTLCAALALMCGVSAARAADVTGVYVAGPARDAEALHLEWSDDEIVGRFVTKDGAYLLEGWLDEPGYLGMLYDAAAPDRGLMYFVAAPVVEGMRFSLYAMSASGEMDLERPTRSYELRRAPGRSPEIPPELMASLTGGDEDGDDVPVTQAPPEAAGIDGGGLPMQTDGPTPAATTGAGPFHGPFHGDDGRGGLALLRFAQQGNRVQGEMSAFGASAQLSGTVSGQSVEGRLQAVDATGTFKGTLTGNRLALTCVLRGEGGESTVSFALERGEPKQMGELDSRLVGTWVKSSSYTSGDFSVASSQTCVIRSDGTLTLYDSRMAGGGDAGSFDSGAPGGGETSRWHTKGNLFYVNGQLYGRYGFNGNTLGFWFSENGKPEIWSRQ